MAISAIRKIVPDPVRIPCYIVVIAGFVTVVELVMEAYAFSLYQSLGVYLSLIVVNCIILGRAEMYASKHGVVDSAIDGAGMGIGFTLAICAMAAIRETLGCGTFCGLPVPWFHENPIGILTMAPGGFFVFGCMIALINKISKGKAIKKKEFGCAGCPGCGKADFTDIRKFNLMFKTHQGVTEDTALNLVPEMEDEIYLRIRDKTVGVSLYICD